MPLIYKKQLKPKGLIGIWKIDENEDYFLRAIELYPIEYEQLEKIKGFRRTEWLASRHLMHVLSERDIRGAVLKDENGKPFLANSPWQVSMSHSNHLAAVIAAPFTVGVDIQKLVPRIVNIAHRWLHHSELNLIREGSHPVEIAHVLWGAKESMFKAYGKGQLDFTEHLRILPFKYDSEGGEIQCKIMHPRKEFYFSGHYELIQDNMFVYISEVPKQ